MAGMVVDALQSFNLVIENLLILTTSTDPVPGYHLQFQSRNRESSDFNNYRWRHKHTRYQCFNLVIENLLILTDPEASIEEAIATDPVSIS